MRHAQFVAVRTLGKGASRQVIVCAAAITPGLRMSSFWIWHFLRTPLFQTPFDFKQLVHVRTEFLFRTAAATGIQIDPTSGTQTFAVYRAQCLHRKRQEYLLAKNVTDREFGSCEERSASVFLFKFDFRVLVEHLFVALAKKQIERLANTNLRRLETSRTRNLQRRFEISGDPNFSSCALGCDAPIKIADLPDIVRSKVDNTGLESSLKREFVVG
jgi:hypothetical protein